jgi:hypothetical protein
MLDSLDDVTKYRPLRNGIIFSFIQDVADGTFNNKTEWGFEVRNKREDIQTPRWGVVESIGRDVPEHIKIGTYILIEQLMWTEAFKVAEIKKWNTNYDKVLATSEVEPKGLL